MPGARDQNLIADKYALDYPRRPLATRLWKSRWNWLALFFSLAVVLVLVAIRGHSAFWAGPVSHVHASFAMDCSKCHTDSWQPALRLASLDSGRHSVPSSACQACHPAGDHHPRHGDEQLSCAVCHQEHRTDHRLTAVADTQCVHCHGNLTGENDQFISFAADIRQFAEGAHGHPEFAILRTDAKPPGPKHGAHQVAKPPSDENRPWLDQGGLFFNHKLHLGADGVLDANRQTVHLTCADCHVPETDGAYMKPLNYHQHCAECHPLRLGGALAELGELPHETPELVRGALRERIAQLQLEPGQVADVPAAPDGHPLGRLLPRPAELTEEQEETAERLLAQADHSVFGPEAKGSCRKCHHVQIRDGRWHVPHVNPTIRETAELNSSVNQPKMVPDRWLAHGKFHHEKHRTVACAECHQAATSEQTTDIMLPSVATCRKCHGTSSATMVSSVSADCVLCHDYHAPLSTPAEGMQLEQLFVYLGQ